MNRAKFLLVFGQKIQEDCSLNAPRIEPFGENHHNLAQKRNKSE